jgi:hypothetical protein
MGADRAYGKAVVPAGTTNRNHGLSYQNIKANSRRAYFTKMLGTGGSAMPAPMWNPTWGGWL